MTARVVSFWCSRLTPSPRLRILVVFAVLALLAPAQTRAQDRITPAPGTWPMPGHDPQHTAYASGTGHLSATASERWTYYVGGYVTTGESLIADVNGDGIDDVLAIVGGKIVVRDLQDNVLWDSAPLGLTEITAFTDLNGDHVPELVAVRSQPAGVFVLSGATGDLLWQRHDFDDPTQNVSRGVGLSQANARVVQLAPGSATPQPAIVLRVAGGDGNLHAFDFSGGFSSPTDAWNFAGPAPGWWMNHVGLGDFDGDGRTDAMAELNGQTVRLLSGSADPTVRGRPMAGTDFVTNDGGQAILRTHAVRMPGATNDVLYFFFPGSFGRIDAAHPAASQYIAYRHRDSAGHGVGDINLDTVGVPNDPVLLAGTGGSYLVVNVFDDHDCEQHTPDSTATCADLDGINDPVGSHQWHTVVFDATTLAMVTQVSGQVAVALLDIDGDGRPEVLTQAAGADYAIQPVSSVTAWHLNTPAGASAMLTSVWAVPNAGLAGLLSRSNPSLAPADNTPIVVASAASRYLLLYEGDTSSTSIGRPVGLQFVDLATGVFFSHTVFAPHVDGRPVGLARSMAGLTAPDTIVVSESDGFFHLFARDFMPPNDTVATFGLVHSGGYISPLAAAHLTGAIPMLADLVTNRSDGSLNTVPVSGATPDRPPTETVRYYGGMFQTPLVVNSEDTPPQPRVIVGNILGGSPYLAAVSPLAPLEVWSSDPFPVAPGGTFMKFAPAVGDADADGVADLFISYDGALASGAVTCCGSSFYNVVSGRAVGGSTHHPLLWSHPFSPDAIGDGQCCWDYGAATTDLDGDGRADLAIAANTRLAVRTGADAPAASQILYLASSFALPSPALPGTTGYAQYGATVIARFDPTATLSAMMGAGPEGGWVAGQYNLAASTPLVPTTADAEYAIPEFSEGTVREGAVASYATPASHVPAALMGFGFGSLYGNFYALEPGARTAGSRALPLRWARCLHDGMADIESGSTVGICSAGQALSNAAAADIDGDGRDEFLVGSADGYLYALHATDGSLAFAYNFHAAVGAPIVADVDGDGTLGVMVSVGDGYVHSLGTASTTALVSLAHITPVQVSHPSGSVSVASAPTPDVTTLTSESLSYLAAAWTDPSSGHDVIYQAQVTTAFGSPVLPWTDVSRPSPATASVVWIAHGTLALGERYVVEVSARAAGSARADLATTNVVQIVDLSPPVVGPVTVGVTLGPRVAHITATATDLTEVVNTTVSVADATGTVEYTVSHATADTLVNVEAWWLPDASDAGVGTGPYTVTVTARDIGGHTASQSAMFSLDVATGGDAGDGAMTDSAMNDATDAMLEAATDIGSVTDGGVDVPITDGALLDMAVVDGNAADARTGVEAGRGAGRGAGGCGCAVPGRGGREKVPWVLTLGLAVVTRRRRTARSSPVARAQEEIIEK